MTLSEFQNKVKSAMLVKAKLDPSFIPSELFLSEYEKLNDQAAIAAGIAIERENGLISSFKLDISGYHDHDEITAFLIERIVKTILWTYGGYKIYLAVPERFAEPVISAYKKGGAREFDADFMAGVYEKPFEVVVIKYDELPEDRKGGKSIGRHLDGCRIGFDAGGSDRKVSAVIDGETVYSEEVVWSPKTTADPAYHYNGIVEAFRTAASHMPRVDAIGVSSAGIYVANRTMVASLFLKVPKDAFDREVKDIYIRAAKEIGDVPLEVANDGDVTALAGSMDLDVDGVLGVAMGTSEAGGYVDIEGNVTGWLNELAFVPCDMNHGAMVDEWSGDVGCGVKYFSQDAAAKLAPAAGIELDPAMSPAEKLKVVQGLAEDGHEGALGIFSTIGIYLGYTLAWYSRFYEFYHVLILGRVTSGAGGSLVLQNARDTLLECFPALAAQITLHLPDESSRRVGQSIAAASLPRTGTI
jgi:predicted NBD/HSP70 family sugar kinase